MNSPPNIAARNDTMDRMHTQHHGFNALDWIAQILLIVGGLNWGLVGLFGIDVVAAILGQGTLPSRIVYILVGLSALWGLAIFRHSRH
jgi:uncharacterized membrane protein YuzA (DUF378 family)